MIAIYCRRHHGGAGRCEDCGALEAYTRQRLDRCPYGAAKPTCANCPIHCYRREMREAIRTVMADAGPRLVLRHPLLALLHVVDGRRAAPRPGPRAGATARQAAAAASSSPRGGPRPAPARRA